MNLADHAGVRLTRGGPRVNGVEIHYAIGGRTSEATVGSNERSDDSDERRTGLSKWRTAADERRTGRSKCLTAFDECGIASEKSDTRAQRCAT